ncbi:Exosome complex component [Spathaspora sp. JA1]|nr:Exosome complex component [Spathaspora sp. JA1]
MSRSIEISENQRKFLLESLRHGIRLSNRSFDSIRDISIYLSPTEYGYAEVSWGKTKLACRVTSTITTPYEDRPFEGIFTINSEISPMASLKFDTNRSNEEVLISRIIEKSIRRSNSLDLESLCIIAGEKVWEIMVDLNYLNFDGNFIDIGCFAVMLALHHFKKPDISINGDSIKVHDINERQPVPLSILHIPICLSYSFYNLGDKESNIKGEQQEDEICILDADLLEELNRDGSLVITLNKNREVIQLSKNGGLPISAQQFLDLAFKSMKIIDQLTDLIKSEIKQHQEMRYKAENFKLLEASADR